jgi:hypothetical protein
MYNTLWDPSVDPQLVSTHGEFYATAEMVMPFKLKRMEERGEVFGVSQILENANWSGARYEYYRNPPQITKPSLHKNDFTNWDVVFAGEAKSIGAGSELVKMVCWLIPKQFGLSKSENYEIWRITILDMRRIIRVQPLINAHQMLPCAFTRPIDDELGNNTNSYAELLEPFNRFSSFQLNMHQQAARRSLYGLTFYLQNKIPALANPATDLVAGTIPVDPSVDDVRKAVWQIFDAPNTQNTLQDLEFMEGLMQKILPTDLMKQVTDLERATRYQAAATVQGSNRRSLKIARIINSQALQGLRTMQMYNIYERQSTMQIITEDGELAEINPRQFRDTNLEFVISDGLKGLDKLSMIEGIKEVLTMVVQNQAASQQFDVPDILNYWTTMIGDRTDFSQFKIESPLDALPPEQKQIAFQLFQQFMAAQQGGQAAGVAGGQVGQPQAGPVQPGMVQ